MLRISNANGRGSPDIYSGPFSLLGRSSQAGLERRRPYDQDLVLPYLHTFHAVKKNEEGAIELLLSMKQSAVKLPSWIWKLRRSQVHIKTP
ncbi:hypothetical protein R1flu_020679 [Riccia fluitans]|uniref:Uncharacterized protein n=1 Tax=Riccia fluitans TaxID=41844 RepID=A0ABD1ZPA6_9MARC